MKTEKFGRFKNYFVGRYYGNTYLFDNETKDAILKLTNKKNLICYDDSKKHSKAMKKFCKDNCLYVTEADLSYLKYAKKKINIITGVISSI